MTSVLVTGVTGFVGRSLLRYFDRKNKSGHLSIQVIGLSRNSSQHQLLERTYPFLRCVSADISSHVPDIPNCDLIFHCATQPARPGNPLEHEATFFEVISGVRNLVSLCKSMKSPPVLTLASSGAIYGTSASFGQPRMESEQSAPSPFDSNSYYGESKRVSEFLFSVADEQGILKFRTARLFSFAGLDLPLTGNFAIGNFVNDALLRRPITVTGNPETTRSFLWQDDLAHWMFTIATDGKARNSYHVGSDKAVTIGNLAHLVADVAYEALNYRPEVMINELLGSTANYYVPSTSQTRHDLNLTETVDLPESIRRMITYHSLQTL